MAERAQVTSVDAVNRFRSELIVFVTRARAVIEEAGDEVLRTRSWVQNDQRQVWEKELRVRSRKLEEARAALFSARMSQFRESASVLQLAVQRAEGAVREAEAKLAALKRWGRELENLSEPLVRQMNQLQGFLSADMGRAIVHLAQVVRTLEAYAAVAAPGGATPSAADPPPDNATTNPPAEEMEKPS